MQGSVSRGGNPSHLLASFRWVGSSWWPAGKKREPASLPHAAESSDPRRSRKLKCRTCRSSCPGGLCRCHRGHRPERREAIDASARDPEPSEPNRKVVNRGDVRRTKSAIRKTLCGGGNLGPLSNAIPRARWMASSPRGAPNAITIGRPRRDESRSNSRRKTSPTVSI